MADSVVPRAVLVGLTTLSVSCICVKLSKLCNGHDAWCLLSVVHPDGQESEHTHTYLEISGHWEVTWWLAHTIEPVLDPKHVHHPWSQVALCSNTRINCVSECICHVFECIRVYLGHCPKYTQICPKYT